MENLMEVKGLRKCYDGFELKDISFTVPSGSVVGIIGSNGAGKTTALKALLGIINADEKSGRILEQDIADASNTVKQKIGVVLDTCAFPESLSVKEVGTLGKASYKCWDEKLFETYIKEFDLESRKTVKSLSRGMGMKLSLAFALAHHPQLLILDEATAGLDPLARDEMLDLLRKFMENDDRGILMSSHITTDLEKIADEIICIEDGHILFDLSKEEICDTAGIAHCRANELQELKASGFFESNDVRVMEGNYGTDVLVPNRFEFAKNFPNIVLDRASIDDYMALVIKGKKEGRK